MTKLGGKKKNAIDRSIWCSPLPSSRRTPSSLVLVVVEVLLLGNSSHLEIVTNSMTLLSTLGKFLSSSTPFSTLEGWGSPATRPVVAAVTMGQGGEGRR